MRVLVCGGRDYHNADAVWGALDAVLKTCKHDYMTIIQGAARGADQLAVAWCLDRSVPYDSYKADWTKHGMAAGPKRNQRMIDEGKPDLVIAFPGGSRTADMIRRALAAGIEVRSYPVANPPKQE